MTTNDKVNRVQVLLGNDPAAQYEVVETYLDIAGDRVLSTMYPFGYADGTTVPAMYEGLQCELAARYFARRGGLGEISHNENGINRTWGSEDDIDILKRISPMVKVVGGSDAES